MRVPVRILVLAFAASCAHRAKTGSPVEGAVGDLASGSPEADSADPVWVANLQPIFQRSAEVKPQGETRAYGVVSMTRGSDADRTHLSINYSTPTTNSSFAWSLHSGRCGSGEISVVAPGSFPPIEVGSNGRGTATADIFFSFPLQGNYHVNVFRGNGSHLEDVVSCGNLRLQRKR